MHETDRQQRVPDEQGQIAPGSPESETEARPTGAGQEPGVTIDFEEIALGSKLVRIRFRGQVYLLRTTRNGKLILNK